MTTIKNICVYCGSSSGRIADYKVVAMSLAKALVDQNITMVYGGASIGLMGVLADQVLKEGGQVIGVIPEGLAHKEIVHPQLTELFITQSIHERKTRMAELADGFIALPGGLGTLEELFEIWTWSQLGIHNKPCGLLNVAGYFDALITFLEHTVTEHFVKPQHYKKLIISTKPNDLLALFQNYQPATDK